MRVKFIKSYRTDDGKLFKAGIYAELAHRYAKKAIRAGSAIPAKGEEREHLGFAYSKDNPPPETQEVEIKDENISETPKSVTPEPNENKVTWWDKIKSLWHQLA